MWIMIRFMVDDDQRGRKNNNKISIKLVISSPIIVSIKLAINHGTLINDLINQNFNDC